MTSKPLMNLVATQCRPEDEEKFNKWYDEVHIPMLFKFKGMNAVTRYKPIKSADEWPIYMAIYEFDSRSAFASYQNSPELAAAMEEMKETWKGEGFKVISRAQYEPMKTWKK